jgi:endonuclease/exonuclease/phosphatase family metal-dependent hydrolase
VPRILTYNVHRCLGRDGHLSPARIAEVIAACEADIVALQELDIGRVRSGGVDQAEAIARELGMHMHFHPALTVMEEHAGAGGVSSSRAGRCGHASMSAAPTSRSSTPISACAGRNA